jgi:hypothetical protein
VINEGNKGIDNILCDKIVLVLYLFILDNTYLLISVFPQSGLLGTAKPMIVPPFKPFLEVHCLKFCNCVP